MSDQVPESVHQIIRQALEMQSTPVVQIEVPRTVPQIIHQRDLIFSQYPALIKLSLEIPGSFAETITAARNAGYRTEGVFKAERKIREKTEDIVRLALSRKEWLQLQEQPADFSGLFHEQAWALTREQMRSFASLSGDHNPIHLNDEAAIAAGFRSVIAHGIFSSAIFSKILGQDLPGPGTVYLSQSLFFKKPVYAGQKLKARVAVVRRCGRRITLETQLRDETDQLLIDGEADVLAGQND